MKKVFNKKNLLFLITTVCLVGLIGIGASYAYYLANFSVSNPENTKNNLTTTSTTDVVMDMQGKYAPSNTVPGFKGVKEVVVRGLGEKNSIPSEASIQITPDFADFGNDVIWKLYKSDMPITCTSNVNEGIRYYDEATCDIPKSASLLLEGGAESSYLNITVNPLTETRYYLVVEYANNGDQSSQMGKSFSITIGLGSKVKNPIDDIIAQLDTTGKCPTVNDDGSVNVTEAEATNGYLCKAKDAYGDSYYYRGNVTNNYVKFGTWSGDVPDIVHGYYSKSSTDYKEYSSLEECQSASSYNVNCTLISNAGKEMYWRIIRINGDNTIRVIYDGTSANANGESRSDSQIGTSVFNSSYDDNAYVGYMYGATGASTYAETHANTNDSTIKTYIDNWYKTNILGTANEQYLADNVFCNDRSISSDKTDSYYNNLGYGKNATLYRWFYGPWSSGGYNSSMRLMCPQKNDAFTVSDTTNGNGALTYSVGLLSIDEIVLAGGWNKKNSGYYLYTGQDWWASSPYYFSSGYARVRSAYLGGYGVYDYYVYCAYGVRPVLNLKAEVLAQGSGTASDPYRISS